MVIVPNGETNPVVLVYTPVCVNGSLEVIVYVIVPHPALLDEANFKGTIFMFGVAELIK